MQRLLDVQQVFLSQLDMLNPAIHYSENSQRFTIKKTVGEGYFEGHSFDDIHLSRLNCCFDKPVRLSNPESYFVYGMNIVLQGHYQLSSSIFTDSLALSAPLLLLRKGNLGNIQATMPKGVSTATFAIDFDEALLQYLLPQQLQAYLLQEPQEPRQTSAKPSQQPPVSQTDLIKANVSKQDIEQFFSQPSPQVLSFPLLDNAILASAWQVLDTPFPRQPLDWLGLQGQVLSFISQLFTWLSQLTTSKQSSLYSLNQTVSERSAIQAKQFINRCYYRNLTIRELAWQVASNECDLKRSFKALTGQTIGAYRTQIRMQHALAWLTNAQLKQDKANLAEIAHRLGYNSTSYFVRVFQKYYGYHPKEYIFKTDTNKN